jgi:Rrf2 family protein
VLTPSKKIFYAVEAVLYIAYNAKADPISGSEVAAAQNLPTRYLEPMMQKLVRSGILRGVRGPQGGYVLGRERRRISLADICNALGISNELPDSTTALGKKILAPTAQELMESWLKSLSTVTINTLCERAGAAHISTSQETTHNFVI